MYRTLNDYNDCNNSPLSNNKIIEAMHKVTEEESISNANNGTVDKSSHTTNTQRENANSIFTSEKLDKSNELADTLNDLTINESKYYASNSVTASDAQGNLTRDPKKVTDTRNGKEKVTDTSNGNFEQELLSNWILPFVVPKMNSRIDNMISPIGGAPQTLSTPATKEVITDAASDGMWVIRNLWQVSRIGVDGITPGYIGQDVR